MWPCLAKALESELQLRLLASAVLNRRRFQPHFTPFPALNAYIMPFGLTIGTERATALQQTIQDELTRRGYSSEADPVMAEYITIMVINNKTSAQITSELEDLIGSDFNSSFTDWLFVEAAKGAAEADVVPPPAVAKPEQPADPGPSKSIPNESSRSGPGAPRNGIYQQALSQALPSSSNPSQKRTASARSPSPTHPNKSRRTDLPTGPRAMYRDGPGSGGNQHANPRSLIDRVGPRGPKNFQRDEIQARIDNIVGNAPDANNMMMPPNFPGMGMDMNAMAVNMASPLMLQEMMMNQMALMAQMASSMGIINPGTGQFGGQGFPMQGGMPNDMNMFPNGMNNGFPSQGQNNNPNNAGRGRGGPPRGGRGTGRGRGGFVAGGPTQQVALSKSGEAVNDTPASFSSPAAIAAPTPITPTPSLPAPSAAAQIAAPAKLAQPAYSLPERPQSPTLCKFALKCTNPHCRYSHPSPVATAESGIVLSNEACEKGKDCKDKDCIKAHVSPATLNPNASEQAPPSAPGPVPPQSHHSHSPIPCRFGAACTRPGCTFSHPARQSQFATQCRFGAACTRAQCPYQHPEGRVLPSTFHRGLSTTGPMVSVPNPETGSMGGSQHRSMTFNNPSANASAKERLEKQMKEIQEKKSEAEKAVKDAEAAAGKKADVKPVSVNA